MRGPIRITAGSDGLLDELSGLWVRITEAGGALGFDRGDPEAAVRGAARAVVDGLGSPDHYLFVVFDESGVRGFAHFRRGHRPVRRHTAELEWLGVHPGLQGTGWGTRLLEHGLAALAKDGVEAVFLRTRSGTGLGGFYRAHGFTERGRWPRAVRFADGGYRDEVWFTKDLP
ncbi:GNAT family N-acetyltransferase [Sciscionella sediminilitoris]|uniref:GNAT family N-acetyltransferase n=1 Tax=Sciscionella sediminilitoris TaxID=1445613 RepID=UPI00068B1415|nr:GNAT family N-acetyltransferase [Sciscionella sp. SE31]